MLVPSLASLTQSGSHLLRRRCPLRGFLGWGRHPILIRREQPILTLVRHDQVSPWVAEELLHVLVGPAGCLSWMFMEVMPPFVQLDFVQLNNEPEVAPPLLDVLCNTAWLH